MKIMFLAAFLLTACVDTETYMTNDQIIAEYQKCKDGGMDARQIGFAGTGPTSRVECVIPSGRNPK